MVIRVSATALLLVFVLAGCSGMSEESPTEAPVENATLSAFETIECVNASGIQGAIDDLNEAHSAVSAGMLLVSEYGTKNMGPLLIIAMQNSSRDIGNVSDRFTNRVVDCGVEGLRKNLDELGETLLELSGIYARHSSIELAYESGDIDRIIELRREEGKSLKAIYDQLLELAQASIDESETPD